MTFYTPDAWIFVIRLYGVFCCYLFCSLLPSSLTHSIALNWWREREKNNICTDGWTNVCTLYKIDFCATYTLTYVPKHTLHMYKQLLMERAIVYLDQTYDFYCYHLIVIVPYSASSLLVCASEIFISLLIWSKP